jgi:uncharacterized coiled-coil DUF342 family protein
MAAMTRLRAAGRRALETLAPTAMQSVSDVPRLRQQLNRVQARMDRMDKLRARLDESTRQVETLRWRIHELQAEVQESRKLQQRVAELTDVVAEIIVPATQRDDERIQRALADFAL